MAKKPSITTVSSGYQSTTTINSNTQNLRDAFDNTLSLDGSTPNAMQADFDMNSNDILNVDKLYINGLYIDGQPVSAGTLNYNGVIKETQTATSGQTVFNLTTMVYNPGINNLSVYVDGVYQNPSTYTENNSTRITFSAGLHVGAIVDFVALSINEITGGADATTITYTPSAQSLYGTSVITAKSALDQISNQSTGSSKVGFLQSGTGATNRAVQTKLRDTVSVQDFGADPTGATDSTAAIRNAIIFARAQGGESRKLRWTRGTYLITGSITIGTNQYVDFDPGVTINFVPTDPLNTYLFVAANQYAVYFNGNGTTINGTRGTVAGQGVGTAFFIYGCDMVTIRDFTINNFATDGITLTGDNTGSGPCTNVLIEDCRVNNCRRNGMSIISAIDCTVIGGSYNGTNGALGGPWAGIDVEPNSDCFLENVNLIGVSTANNDGAGIQFTPGALSNNVGRRFSVFVTGGRSVSDGDLTGVSGLEFRNGGTLINKVFGEVVVNGFVVDSPTSRGVSFREWEHNKCPRAVLNSVTVYNPDSTLNAVSNADRSGFVIGLDSSQNATTLGNIVLNNCHAEDTRSSPRMVFGMVVFSDASKEIKDVTVIDPRSVNFTAGNKADIITATASGSGTSNFFDVIYTQPIPVDLAASQSIADFGGKRINVTASSNSFTLPSASKCGNLIYEIQNAVGVASTTIAVQTGETILGTVGVASTGIVLDAGGFIRLRSLASGSWHVEALEGLWRIPGMSIARKIQFSTAAPTSGTWQQGDIVFNASATVGQPQGWQCTANGAPGTWVSMGNL